MGWGPHGHSKKIAGMLLLFILSPAQSVKFDHAQLSTTWLTVKVHIYWEHIQSSPLALRTRSLPGNSCHD